MARIPVPTGLACALIRALCGTLRIEVCDHAGVLDPTVKQPYIWTLWHNRLLLVPYVRERKARHRTGAVLTSASRDGNLLAAFIKNFGLEAERGSTSRRGARGLMGLVSWLERGVDVSITPDGPRGPRYRMSPGVVWLAQRTGVPLLLIGVDFSRAWRLPSWDGFFVPMPFSRVKVTFGPAVTVAACDDEAGLELERARIERLLVEMNPDRGFEAAEATRSP